MLDQHQQSVQYICFLEYSLKRKVRSESGVSVITILTSPKPKYTNKDGKIVEQEFSCGHDCAYCPKEPEIKLNLQIIDINPNFIDIFGKELEKYLTGLKKIG